MDNVCFQSLAHAFMRIMKQLINISDDFKVTPKYKKSLEYAAELGNRIRNEYLHLADFEKIFKASKASKLAKL
jgi:hypothetical protein